MSDGKKTFIFAISAFRILVYLYITLSGLPSLPTIISLQTLTDKKLHILIIHSRKDDE